MAEVVVLHCGPVVTIEESFAKGKKRFFTGKPCIGGHVDERYVSGSCVECGRIRREAARKKPRRKFPTEVRVLYDGPALSIDAAKERGLKRYFNGRPCPKGHVAERLIVGRRCLECHRINSKQYIRPRSEDRKLKRKEYYHKEKEAMRRRRDAERAKITGRPKPTVCDICGCKGKIVFDHCHDKGHFRGWLCSPCNTALGLAKDDPSLLRKMAKYLERTSGEVGSGAEEQTPLLRLCRAG